MLFVDFQEPYKGYGVLFRTFCFFDSGNQASTGKGNVRRRTAPDVYYVILTMIVYLEHFTFS